MGLLDAQGLRYLADALEALDSETTPTEGVYLKVLEAKLVYPGELTEEDPRPVYVAFVPALGGYYVYVSSGYEASAAEAWDEVFSD